MGLFDKKENFDIECSDRRIKDMIDDYYQEEPDGYRYYAEKTAFFVEYGIRYFKMIAQWLELEYANHYSDELCDIPNYKTFLELEKSMLDNPIEYQNKTVCVEGYYAHGAFDTVYLYPVPCRSEIEKKTAYTLADFGAFDDLVLIGKRAEEINDTYKCGTHIRIYGVTSPRKDWGGVPIIIERYEILD